MIGDTNISQKVRDLEVNLLVKKNRRDQLSKRIDDV